WCLLYSSYVPLSSVSFVLPRLPPPRSSLFPYTTLFRSYPFFAGGNAFSIMTYPSIAIAAEHPEKSKIAGKNRYCLVPGYVVNGKDRKSTRLNSSHGSISYAVFCLKKKTRTRHKGPNSAT